MTHSCRHHFHQLTLRLLELEFEIVAPVSEKDHRTWHIVVLNVNKMEADDFKVLWFLVSQISFSVLCLIHIYNLIKMIILFEHEGTFNWLDALQTRFFIHNNLVILHVILIEHANRQ